METLRFVKIIKSLCYDIFIDRVIDFINSGEHWAFKYRRDI